MLGAVYLSAIIGAGFATGREIMTYFARFGYWGLIGLFAACALIAFCGARALCAVLHGNIQDPHSLNVAAGGKAIGSFITVCCGLFAYSAYIIMLAGIKQLCGGSLASVLLVSVCAYLVLYKGFGTLVKVCGICAPIIAVLIAVTALSGSFASAPPPAEQVLYETAPLRMALRAFLYAGYNVLTSICVLGRSIKLLESKRTAVWGGILGGGMLFLSGAAVLVALVHGGLSPDQYEMPILALFSKGSMIFHAVLLLTMFISAISGLTSTCIFFTNLLPERKMGVLLGVLAIPATYVTFGRLMDILYPIFGFAGIFLMIVLALMGNKNV